MNPTIFCQQQLLLALPKFLSETYFGKAIRAARPELEYPCWLCRTGQFRTHCLPRVGSNYHTVLMGLGISFFFSIFHWGNCRGVFCCERADSISDQLSGILLSGHHVGVALLTFIQRKGNAAMAETAVLLIPYLKHGIFNRTFFDAREDFRMAKLTSVPQGMFLM